VGIIACPLTGSFTPVENGPLSDVPPFDCTTHDTATLATDGASVSFAHLGGLVRAGSLSIVLLPGAADRVVLSRPGPAVLAVVPAPAPPPDDLAPPTLPASAAAPAPQAVTAPIIAPEPATPTLVPHHHRRAVPHTTVAAAPAAPLQTTPRVVLVATLAAIAGAAIVLRRPATAAGTRGFHRFARERTGPAPRV
jgi:hypothetical protein